MKGIGAMDVVLLRDSIIVAIFLIPGFIIAYNVNNWHHHEEHIYGIQVPSDIGNNGLFVSESDRQTFIMQKMEMAKAVGNTTVYFRNGNYTFVNNSNLTP